MTIWRKKLGGKNLISNEIICERPTTPDISSGFSSIDPLTFIVSIHSEHPLVQESLFLCLFFRRIGAKCTVNKSIICSSIVRGRSPRKPSSLSYRDSFKVLNPTAGSCDRENSADSTSHRNTPCVEHVFVDTRVAIRHAHVLSESTRRLGICSNRAVQAEIVNRIRKCVTA